MKNGESELIVEQWLGLPYRSSPELLFKYDDKDDIDVSKLTYEEAEQALEKLWTYLFGYATLVFINPNSKEETDEKIILVSNMGS